MFSKDKVSSEWLKSQVEVVGNDFINSKGNEILEKEARKSLDFFVVEYAESYEKASQSEKDNLIPPEKVKQHVLDYVAMREKANELLTKEERQEINEKANNKNTNAQEIEH